MVWFAGATPDQSLESLNSPEHGRILLYFPVWGLSIFLIRPLFQKTPFSKLNIWPLRQQTLLKPRALYNLSSWSAVNAGVAGACCDGQREPQEQKSLGCVVAQAFFSRGASAISLK